MPPDLADLPLLDCHIHFAHPDYGQGLLAILDEARISRFNLVCTPHRSRLSLVPDALYLKSQYPERVYVFGGLDISPLFFARDSCGALFAQDAERLLAMGCDGVKMIEGKPDLRKTLPIPDFDSPAYEPYWSLMEQKQIPILFHVNDPEEFWDARRVPDWARRQGWFYGDGTYINNEAQYAQVLRVLERFPGLRVVFAHFFFMSAQLPRLGALLERFPGVHVDLTPGIEMYHNLGRDPSAAREFFIKFQDRILFGTDIGAKALLSTPELGIEPHESSLRIELVRRFLELEGEFTLDVEGGFLFGRFSGPFQGLGLRRPVLEKIYCRNFEALAGSRPAPLDPDRIVQECERLTGVIGVMGSAQPDVPGDVSVATRVRDHFARPT
jgi:predicted TIM-barrel fold metal-dependent hydrolase